MDTLLSIILVLTVITLIVSVVIFIKVKKISSFDSYVKKQAKKQMNNTVTKSKKQLIFTPFEEGLNKISKNRYEELETLIVESDITQIQKHIKNDKFNYEELVLFYINKIKQYDNNKLNTIIEINEDALILAKEMDKKLKNGTIVGKLHGIPVLLKDNIGTGDKLHNTAGAKALEMSSSDRDAYIVSKLKQSGAIILGKANLSEWANFMSLNAPNGYSALGGQTHNPYGNFDVGGSSSGSAAGVASNFATISIGTETTGSIIYPASQNSVVGIKPSLGLWSRDRIIPLAHDLDTAGPITRNVEDAAILLSELVGQDNNDEITCHSNIKRDYTKYLLDDGFKKMKIGIVTNKEVVSSYRKEDKIIIDRIMQELTNEGAIVKEIMLDKKAFDLETHIDVFTYEYKNDVEKYLHDIGEKAPVKTIKEIAEYNKKDIDNHAPFGQYFIEKSRDTKTTEEENNRNVVFNQRNTSDSIDEALKNNNVDVLMSLSNYLSAVYATAGYPAINIPAGYRSNGEPIGVTFVSGKYREDLLIRAGYSYEQKFNYRIKPLLKK
ncbi:MAG: amidase family protein [Vallitalea sp.]|jgi:amidase|nr:amidase family protein [Vallitalea sp.]